MNTLVLHTPKPAWLVKAIKKARGPAKITLTEPELDKLLSEAYADGRSDQLEEMKEKT